MRTLLLFTLITAGCTTEPVSESRELCTERTIGDPAQPIELAILTRDRDGEVRDVVDHSPAEVVLSDGRRGLVLSVRARNLDGCAVAVVMRSPERAELRGGTMVQLDVTGNPDSADALQFVELPTATANDTIDVVIQDATGRWATATYSP